MKRLTVLELNPSGGYLLPDIVGDATITGGGVYVFKPGETAHPEPRHVHDVDEVFIFLQGSGIIPIDGIDHPVQAGDVVVVAAGEDHHTRSSSDDPLVAAWYLMDRSALGDPALPITSLPPTGLAPVEADVEGGGDPPSLNFLHHRHKAGGIGTPQPLTRYTLHRPDRPGASARL